MMRFTKRALSAFLAFVMVFTMLPLDVWATSADQSVNIGSSVDPNGRPEGAPQTYTLYVTHLLNTNIGTFVDEDVEYTLSAEDFTDGAYDPSALVYSRTGMELAEADPVTLESFQDGKANITLTYRVADGYMAVRKNAGDVSTFEVFVGTLDDVTLVPVGSKVVLVNFVTDEGLILQSSYSKELTAETGYEFSYEIPSFEGYTPALEDTGVFSLSEEGFLTADLGAQAEDNFEVTVVYTPNAIEYTVVHKFPNLTDGGYVEETQPMNGRYGEMTQAEPVEKEGFTPGEITQIPLTGEGPFTVKIEYQRNQYVLTYDTQGGSYVAPRYGKYGQELTVYGKTEGTTELTCGFDYEHKHSDYGGECYTKREGWFGSTWYEFTCKLTEHTHSDGCYTTTPGTWEPQPTRQGYVFAGWYSDEACTQEASATLTLTQDTKVYAKWTPANVSYTIAYFAENADDDNYSYVGSVGMTAATGTTVEATAGSQKPSGFDTQHFTFVRGTSATVAPDGSTVVNAYYSRNEYTLTFVVKKGSGWGQTEETVATLTRKYDAYIGDWWIEHVGADSEYSNGQWYWDENKRTAYQNNMPGEDKSCTFIETKGTRRDLYYYVEDPNGTIQHNGLTFSEYTHVTLFMSSGYLTYNEEYFPIAGYDRYDTSVEDWQGSGTGNVSLGNVTEFYFYYSAQEYPLDLYDYDGTLLSSDPVKFGTDINQYLSAAQTTPPVEGAAFKGWFTDPARTEPYEGDYKMPMGLVLYADWDLPQVKVTFKVQMGEKVETVTYGETVESYIPVVDGYTFAGWYTDENHTELFDFNQRITQDTVIYAKFTKRNTVSYTVEFVTNKGEQVAEPETHTGVVDASYTAKAVVPTGQFAGYIVDKPNDTITLKRGEENKITFTYYPAASFAYTVQYQYGDKVLYQTEPITPPAQTITVRADADVLNDLMAKGYELSGESYQQVTLSATQKNVVVFQMAPAEFTITYLSDPQGTTVTMPNNPTSYTVNTETFTLENPTLEGYRFLGWTTGQGTTPAITEPELSVSVEQGSVGHLIFIANWERSVFTIKYETDGYGTVSPESEQVNSGGNAQGSTATPNQGYYFVNWTDEDGTVVGSEEKFAPTSVTADATYTAHFAPKTAITVKAKDFSKTYDGTKLEVKDDNWEITSGSLPDQYRLVATVENLDTFNVINVGDSTTYGFETVTIYDNNGNNVTEQFTINRLPGNLTIEKREVTLTSATDSKEYDGTALTNDEVTVGGDGFADGEGASYTVTGSQTVVGESANTFTYELSEVTKAENYNIIKSEGKLTVTDRESKYEITVEAKSDTAKYDGTEKTVSGLVTNSFTVNGQTYKVEGLSASASGTDAGTYTSNVTGTAVVKDAAGNDVTSQFTVTKQAGTLTIEKRNVTLTSATDSKEYDGTALTNDEVTVGGDGFADGEGATYTVTGSQTLVGESDNMFTYQLNEGTKAGNYIVTPEYGKLTVTDRESKYEITVEAKSDTAKYDGTEKTVSGLVTNSFTVNEQTYTVEGLSASASGTNAGTYTSEVTGTAIVKDSEGNDVTDQFTVKTQAGTLTIEKRKVTLTSATDSKEYDGTALTNDEVTVGGDGFADGEGATYIVTGSQTLVGESDNMFTYQLNEGTKAENYNITKTEGTLKVTAPDPTEFPYITKSHDENKEYYPGDTVTYTITVKNIFSVDAVVTVTERSGVTLVGAVNGAITETLKPGTEGVYTATYTVDEDDLVDYAFHNTVSVTIVPMDDGMEPIEDTATDTVPVNVPELSVEKQVTSEPANGEYYVLKEEIAYKITVKNTGNVTVSNITVEDKLADEVWTIESLNPGESKEFETSHQVAEADLGSPYVNVATAEGKAPNGSEVKAEDSATATTDSRTPKLDVTKVASKPANGTEYALDETITYTITVKNTGNVTLENIFVSDKFSRDGGTTWEEIKDKLTPSASTPITLEPGEQKIYTYQYTVVEEDLGKTLQNTATAIAPNPDDPTENVTDDTITSGEKVEDPNPDLSVDKKVTSDPGSDGVYDLGDTITYTITVQNEGNVTLTGVDVKDELLADGQKIHDLVVTGGDNITLKPKGHEGDTVILNVDYTVKEEDLGKTLVNTATATAEQTEPEDPNKPVEDKDETDGEKTEDPTPNMTVDKTVVNGKASYQVGDVITYEITVTNTGNTTIHNVELMDHMNAHGKVTFEDLGGGQMVGGSPVLAALAPKTAWVVTCQYTVQLADADSDGTTISNKVTVNAEDGPDGKDPEDQTPGEKIDPIYTLTIKYQNGAKVDLRNPDTVKLHAGDVYTVVAPGINGYHLSDKADAKFDFTMPDEDTTIVIIYARNPVEEDDDDPVVNPDNDPDETTEETEDEVDPGVYIEDPDDYTLTPITEEEPPLADLDVGDHTCCIMHFLLMLAAMVVLGFYTDSKKKHQARIFELKRTLAMEKGKNPDGDNSQQS